MTNEEISGIAVNAVMEKIADMVKKGKSQSGLSEDEHAIAMGEAVWQVLQAGDPSEVNAKRRISVAIRAVKNGSQMRQTAEKRGILKESVKGDKTADVFSQYS